MSTLPDLSPLPSTAAQTAAAASLALASPRHVAKAIALAAAEAAALADPSTSVWHLPYAAHVHRDVAYDADVPPADLEFPPLPDIIRCARQPTGNCRPPADPTLPSSLPSDAAGTATAVAGPAVEPSDMAPPPDRIHFDVMAALDGDRMEEFKDTFLSTADALTPLQFVKAIRPFMPAQLPGITEVQLIAKLCEFFSDVDVNGDGTMQWQEFTGAVIDAGMIESDVSRTDRILEYWNSPLVDSTRHAHWCASGLSQRCSAGDISFSTRAYSVYQPSFALQPLISLFCGQTSFPLCLVYMHACVFTIYSPAQCPCTIIAAHRIDRLAYIDVLDQVISWEKSSDYNFRVYDAKTGRLRYTVRSPRSCLSHLFAFTFATLFQREFEIDNQITT